ncbi:hypothetical protein ACH5RR_008491 [Cinchona calisaya]|uniref:Uncharacterized protein n=1 Tax=Cinchona calisaya TaxID=153742 RepID=A0ABD3ABR4_9GENT
MKRWKRCPKESSSLNAQPNTLTGLVAPELMHYKRTRILPDEDLTPFNTSSKGILYQIQHTRIIQPLLPIGLEYHQRDQSEYCAHNGDHCHDTDSCNYLKIEIGRTIKDHQCLSRVNNNMAGVIETIVGGDSSRDSTTDGKLCLTNSFCRNYTKRSQVTLEYSLY